MRCWFVGVNRVCLRDVLGKYLMRRQSNILHQLDARKRKLQDISVLLSPRLVKIIDLSMR